MTKELEKEYLEDLDHYDEGMGIHSTSYKKCKERLIRLAKIDSASPSEALECLENYLFNEWTQNHVNFECDYKLEAELDKQLNNLKSIKQTLLKAQEDNKLKVDICEMFGLDNLFPYNDTDAILKELEEYMDRHNQLFVDSAKKSKKLKEQEKDLAKYKKAWEVVKEKNVNIGLLKGTIIMVSIGDTDWKYYNRMIMEDRHNSKYELTEEEFDLLKEMIG